MKPSIGRIVHYVGISGQHFAAVVTGLHDHPEQVTLHAFHPEDMTGAASVQTLVLQDEGDQKRPRTWHWPERTE